jgi:hypothetical protein
MKKVLALVSTLALAGSLLGQGEINGINFNPANNVDGQVTRADGTTLAGTETMGQLYAGTGGSLAPIGSPTAFLQNGIVSFGTVVVPGIAAGADADIQLRSWLAADGADYDAAVAAMGEVGESNVTTITLGGGVNPPAFMSGLTQTAMYVVPEPSTWALMALGLGALALRRRK